MHHFEVLGKLESLKWILISSCNFFVGEVGDGVVGGAGGRSIYKIFFISKIQLVVYYQCSILIG